MLIIRRTKRRVYAGYGSRKCRYGFYVNFSVQPYTVGQEKTISLRYMKNIGRIKTFTITATMLIFILQGAWLYYTYAVVQQQTSAHINNAFKEASYKELRKRETESKRIIYKGQKKGQENVIGSMEIDTGDAPEISLNLVLQEHLYKNRFYVSLHTLDSIFHLEINNKNIHGKFIINRINTKTGVILETSDKRFHGSLAGAFYSNIIPVRMDKSQGVQVVLVSPYRAVFLQMIFILILSALLIIFVAYAIFYQMNSLLKEKHLRQLHTDFSHALTHDMATPLQTIAQVNNLLANEKLYNEPEKRAKYIDLARQQILNLQALTERILTVARAEKSSLELNPSQVNLKDIIVPLTEKFKIQAKKPVEFEVSFTPENINMQLDTTLISNAVSNLIDNAIKYSGNSVTINIRCEQKDNNVFLHIKDNGYGMSEKDQARVFTMFERGKAVARQQARGFGLGLSYVKSVVEAHGGAVNLSSKEGEGAEFVLVLPLC
jgi:two-component system, OmpR family, phosphate regulon sensor histidine kinase PhoR